MYKYIHIYLWAAESKLCTNPLNFLILKLWTIQSMLYSEWLSPTEFGKNIFKERQDNRKDFWADRGENGRKMCKHHSLKLLGWITDCLEALSRSWCSFPGSATGCSWVTADGSHPCTRWDRQGGEGTRFLITVWRWSHLSKGCFLNLTPWILQGTEIWLPLTVSF